MKLRRRVASHSRLSTLASGLLVGLVVMGFVVSAAGAVSPSRPAGIRLDPKRFAELATGIVLVRDFNCQGVVTAEGTGFLIGTRLVMTAAHVVKGACTTKVQTSRGGWISVDRRAQWSAFGAHNATAVDLATLRLHSAMNADSYLFTIRTWSPPVGAGVATLGHPLGEQQLSITQGHVLWKGHVSGVPMLGLRLLGAEGLSGSPIVDNNGQVESVLQIGLGAKDVLGQRTSGAILGIDLPSWWPKAKQDLCRAYPAGGLPDCPGSKPKPPPPPPPPQPAAPASTPLTVTDAWISSDSAGATRINAFPGTCPATIYYWITYLPPSQPHTLQAQWLDPLGRILYTTRPHTALAPSTSTREAITFNGSCQYIPGLWRVRWYVDGSIARELTLLAPPWS